MTDAVIVATARTPIGRARKGSLVDVDAFELAQIAVGAAVERSGIATTDIDDIVVAESLQGGGVIARNIAVRLGLVSVPGLADNRHCAAGLSAVQIAVGGHPRRHGPRRRGRWHRELEHVTADAASRRSRGGAPVPWMSPSHPETPDAPACDMSITVGENTAREMGLSRQDVDAWALYSTENALRSIDEGAFEAEIVPVPVTGPDGEQRLFSVDEHPRRGSSMESLGALPVLHPEIEGATVTAGNAAGLNDGAAAVVVTSSDFAERARARADGTGAVVGVGRPRAGAYRPRAHARDPEGARPHRDVDRRHRPVGDQRGVLLGAGRRRRASSGSRRRS